MNKEQIDKLEYLFEKRKEFQSFINCNSNICRISFGDEWSNGKSFSWEDCKMVNSEDFKQDVIALAKKYMTSIDEQIENVIMDG